MGLPFRCGSLCDYHAKSNEPRRLKTPSQVATPSWKTRAYDACERYMVGNVRIDVGCGSCSRGKWGRIVNIKMALGPEKRSPLSSDSSSKFHYIAADTDDFKCQFLLPPSTAHLIPTLADVYTINTPAQSTNSTQGTHAVSRGRSSLEL